VVRRRPPRSVQQFHVPEFVERDATPVMRRSHRLQTTVAFAAVLIAKRPELPFFVPPKPMRTEQTASIVINSRDWPSVLHGRAHHPINIGRQANPICSRIAPHTFRLAPRGTITPSGPIFYNTVVLVADHSDGVRSPPQGRLRPSLNTRASVPLRRPGIRTSTTTDSLPNGGKAPSSC
jgi:hypothetical protein